MRALMLSLALLPSLAVFSAAIAPGDLRPALTNAEQKFYQQKLQSDPTAAENFLITREYVRKAQAVQAGTLSPLSFPPEKPAGFNVAYLQANDPSVINSALGKFLAAGAGKTNWVG